MMAQNELGRVTREKNALAAGFARIAAGEVPDAQRFASQVLSKLAAGELRKAAV